MTRKRKTRDALEILDQMIGDDQALRRSVEEETVHSRVASLLYEARVRADLTQKELADLVSTQQSVISRLESADYRGHSVSMLVRVAEALGARIEIALVPRKGRRRTG